MRLNLIVVMVLPIAMIGACSVDAETATGLGILSGGANEGSDGFMSSEDNGEGTGGNGGTGDSEGAGGLGTSSGGEASSTGQSTDDDGCESKTWYADADGDGYGDPQTAIEACEAPSEYVDNDEDCNDDNEGINPGVAEICDEIDNDCDMLIDEYSSANDSCNDCTLVQEGGRDFWFCHQVQDFDAARDACHAFGAELASIHSAAETIFINNQINALPNRRWWIGLTDSMQRDTFVWLDGSLLDYTNWNEDEPNDDGNGEDCVEIRQNDDREWNDNSCSNSIFYICATPPP